MLVSNFYTNNQSVISQKQNIVIADLHAKVGKDKMSFPTSSIFNITLKLFLENCNHIVPKRLHRFVSFLVCSHLGLSIKKHIPIVTADYWHFTKRKVFVDTVYRAIGTRAHTTGNGCCRLALKQATMRACRIFHNQRSHVQAYCQSRTIPSRYLFQSVKFPQGLGHCMFLLSCADCHSLKALSFQQGHLV